MEAIIGILGQVIEVGKCICGPVKCHLNYLRCFSKNIQSLRDEAQKLKDNYDELQIRVDDARNNAQVIYPRVMAWLESASQRKDIINGIENDVPKVQKGCLNLISRYSLSKQAKKTAEALKEFHNKCEFDQISQNAPPTSVESLPLEQKEEFETRKIIEDDVMKALTNNYVNMIGLCGMGGVGKTTMAKRIMDRVKEEKLFDEALKVVVGQRVEIFKIQQSIADQLYLPLNAEDLVTRACKLLTRLTADTKRILIVIDDVWECLHLKDLGIPIGNTSSGGCTVLLTSRDKSLLNIMGTQRIYIIGTLLEREAWLLFREKTGNFVGREYLRSIAEDVAKACKDLPVALMAVGGALRNKVSRQLWEDALVQLRSSNPRDLPGVLLDFYKPLKLSYDYLQDKDARSLFLLCSVFEEDVNIHLDILSWYGRGLDVFQRLENLTETRNRTYALIEVLKNHSLLLDGSDKHCVKMHDVVRDTALYIASKEKLGGSVINLDRPIWEYCYEDCFWISLTNLSNKTKFPPGLKCPSLRLLMMKSGNEQQYDDEMRLPDSFFEGMQKIRVLFMEEIHIRSLPQTTQLLKNLKTLYLFNCQVLESISIVGNLLKLEILSCSDCYNIRALPREIGRLKHLMLLEIIRCRNLKRIVPGIISKLINLEELKIKCSFNGWEAKKNNARENAALVELESLTKLTCLELEINNISLVAEEIRLPSGIVNHGISLIMKEERDSYFFMQEQDSLWDRYFSKMCLEIPGQMNVGNWIKTLVRSAEFLDLKGDGATQALVGLTWKLQSLTLRSCSLVKKLLNRTTACNFPLLESLTLAYLDNLVEIFPPKPHKFSCFENLRTISIEDCPRLRYLFAMSAAIRFLTQLQDLTVIDCEAMEDMIIFSDDDDKMEKDGEIGRHNLQIALPKLSCLKLAGLPRLILAQETLSKIVAPDNLKMLHLERLKDDAISNVWWCLFNSFGNLERIEIFYFNGIKNLMSPSIARNLVCLKTLGIHSCKTMSEVIAEDDDDDKQVQVRGFITLFPKLEELDLACLPKLKSFSQRNYHNTTLKLPSLRDVAIDDCPQMEAFIRGSLSTPKLEHIQIDLRTIKIKDLNEAVQQNFKRWVCSVDTN